MYTEVAKINGKNEFFTHEIMKEKSSHAGFAGAVRLQKLWPQYCDKA